MAPDVRDQVHVVGGQPEGRGQGLRRPLVRLVLPGHQLVGVEADHVPVAFRDAEHLADHVIGHRGGEVAGEVEVVLLQQGFQPPAGQLTDAGLPAGDAARGELLLHQPAQPGVVGRVQGEEEDVLVRLRAPQRRFERYPVPVGEQDRVAKRGEHIRVPGEGVEIALRVVEDRRVLAHPRVHRIGVLLHLVGERVVHDRRIGGRHLALTTSSSVRINLLQCRVWPVPHGSRPPRRGQCRAAARSRQAGRAASLCTRRAAGTRAANGRRAG